MSDIDYENDDIDYENDDIEDIFPNSLFNICNLKLDRVIIYNDIVCIKCAFNCYCYSEAPRIPEYFICRHPGYITVRNLIDCLVDNNFNPMCNHNYLEAFEVTSEAQVIPWFGS